MATPTTHNAFASRTRLTLSAIAALLAGVVAFVIALTATRGSSADWHITAPCAALGTFLIAMLAFWLLLGLGQRLRIWVGVVAGLVAGVLAHVVSWYFILVAAYLLGWRSSLGDAPVNPLQAVIACWVYAAASLLLVGWVTIPLSAVFGGVFAFIARNMQSATERV